jgi:motility quorum-sensing regulator/GCU-specific mRNA interferase toxin
MPGPPTYDLAHLQQLVGQGEISRRITEASSRGATRLGLHESDIIDAVLELDSAHFYKSMESEQCPGLWQDVYHRPYRGVDLYIKLQLSPSGIAVVVQFKRR